MKMSERTKCVIEKCTGETAYKLCAGHLKIWGTSPELDHTNWAIKEGSSSFAYAASKTAFADFVRRVDAEARNR